tara:strand:- start:577 stop:765 length:189 start_codon:yes stop_codon:yes gene_type:complete
VEFIYILRVNYNKKEHQGNIMLDKKSEINMNILHYIFGRIFCMRRRHILSRSPGMAVCQGWL